MQKELLSLIVLVALAQNGVGAESQERRCELDIRPTGDSVIGRIRDSAAGRTWADSTYGYELQLEDGAIHQGMTQISVRRNRADWVIQGRMLNGAVAVRHVLAVLKAGDCIEEQITLRNLSSTAISIADVAFGFNKVLGPDTINLRWVAVPFRRRADGKLHDYSTAELAAGQFSNSDWKNEPAVGTQQVCDKTKLRSEAWVWTDGKCGLLISKYNPEHIEHSVAHVAQSGRDKRLCFGGASLSLYREPRAATLLLPGQTFSFGRTRYCLFEGGWERGYGLQREFLARKGHRFPKDYEPPLNWNELFDVGWYHSDRVQLRQHYTRDTLFEEAAKARQAGCDLLYLDPGWEICEGTTLWDKERLGTVSDFGKELKKRYDQKLGYRTIGRVYRDEFPEDWYIRRNGQKRYNPPSNSATPALESVPLSDAHGRRNLALLPDSKASASSVIPGYPDKHTTGHLTTVTTIMTRVGFRRVSPPGWQLSSARSTQLTK